MLDQPPESRARRAKELCAEDPDLGREVDVLLQADLEAEHFLEEPLSPGPTAYFPSAGGRLGPYRLLAPVGQGGMSRVYLAVRGDDQYRQRVAVKVLRPGVGADAGARLRQERQILAALEHPHIASFYFGDTSGDGSPYIAMEFVDGLRLDEYCRRRRPSVEDRLDLFLKICDAVAYAHRNLVVHRDLKPGNILVTPGGTPKLLDFGIAKLLNPGLAGQDLPPTLSWSRPLTPKYASPEQLRGEPVTTATDVYSLGVVLYEVLTGTLPQEGFGGSGPKGEREAASPDPIKPSQAALGLPKDDPLRPPERRASELARRLSGDLDHILLKALRKEPEQRYGSVEAFAEDLRRHLRQEPVRARKGTWAYRAGRFFKRYRWQAAAVAGLLLLTLGFTLAMAHQTRKIRIQAEEIARERDQARRESQQRQRVVEFLEEVLDQAGRLESEGQSFSAQHFLELGLEMVDAREDEAEVQADLLATLARSLVKLHLVERSLEPAREALRLRRQVFGEDSLQAADSYVDLGTIHFQLGQVKEAERLSRKAVAAFEASPEADALGHIAALTNLATAVLNLNREEEALGHFRQALELRRRHYGDHHPEVIQGLNHIGLTIASKGRFAEAEGFLRQALEAHREVSNPLDWTLAYTLNNLAYTFESRQDWTRAEPLFQEALDIWRQILRPNDPQLGFALQGLGRVYLGQGRPAEAEVLFRELSALLAQTLPPHHWRHAQADGLVGWALFDQGNWQDAEPLLVRCLEVMASRAGTYRPDLAATRERLRRLYEETDRPQMAARLDSEGDAPGGGG